MEYSAWNSIIMMNFIDKLPFPIFFATKIELSEFKLSKQFNWKKFSKTFEKFVKNY